MDLPDTSLRQADVMAWARFCQKQGDALYGGAYMRFEKANSWYEDYNFCIVDARNGVPRAQQYIAKFKLLGGFECFSKKP